MTMAVTMTVVGSNSSGQLVGSDSDSGSGSDVGSLALHMHRAGVDLWGTFGECTQVHMRTKVRAREDDGGSNHSSKRVVVRGGQ